VARRVVLGLGAALLLLYVVAGVAMTLNQRRFVYYPDPTQVTPEATGVQGFATVAIPTADGERLVGWWRPPRPGAGVVLYLHGNAGNLADRAGRLEELAFTGLGVLGIDYRGYGGSTGSPSEEGLAQDAEAAYAWLRQSAPGAPVALFGESLGTGVAVRLADEQPVAGLVLDSPYASIVRLGERSAPWLPVRWLMRERYDSEARIDGVDAPLLIIHCGVDRQIPVAEGRRLFEAAEEPKEMIVLPGCGHIDTWQGAARQRALSALQAWTAQP
jgi:fermentation-respiration switch protein FrsA (DUF1100 family)